jgi:hypothetical protein
MTLDGSRLLYRSSILTWFALLPSTLCFNAAINTLFPLQIGIFAAFSMRAADVDVLSQGG